MDFGKEMRHMKAHDFRRLFRRIDRQQPWEDALWQSGRRSDERDQKAHALADRLADLDAALKAIMDD
jgi:hypothetical protein